MSAYLGKVSLHVFSKKGDFLLASLLAILAFGKSYSQETEKTESKDEFEIIEELNLKRNMIMDSIIYLERQITEEENKIGVIENRLRYYDSYDNYKKILEALNSVKSKTATSSQKVFLDDKLIYYGSDNELERSIQANEMDMDEVQRSSSSLTNSKAKIVSYENKAKNFRSSLDLMAREIDKRIDKLDNKNYFRSEISYIFSSLVAIVIAGFFLIVYYKENVVSDIFSGDKGIQFITLFLIIIAVILFGIMGILESRELSALLGALSGYILGRSTYTVRKQNNSSEKEDVIQNNNDKHS